MTCVVITDFRRKSMTCVGNQRLVQETSRSLFRKVFVMKTSSFPIRFFYSSNLFSKSIIFLNQSFLQEGHRAQGGPTRRKQLCEHGAADCGFFLLACLEELGEP